ncbi:chaperone protein DnaK 1-like [Dermatophagoides farinae]|uniref:chaperone protein DnaK 1-like n=1 Tax=Dermatophagoides farinae TaxID=6954 RepID=UPI003F5E551A
MLSVFTKKNSKNNETTTTVNRVKEPPIIGIDLGTTNSCVAVFENGESKVIKDDEGHATVPSMISISGNDVVRGHSAKNQGLINANNTLFATKRFIGRKYNEMAEKAKSLPYKVVPGPNGDAWIEIDGKKVSPCQVAAEILKEMKGISERYLGKEVKDAVITVPAYFNESQRQATKDAGKIAGLNVMRLINEPTSAALAYGINSLKNDNKQLRVAVFDLGGGTFDISILEINGSVIEVKATNGDSSLGGEDFDRRLQSYIEDEIKKELKVDIEKDATLLLH